EGYEWNWLNPLTRRFAGADQPAAQLRRGSPRQGLLEVSGSIGSDGRARHLYMRHAHDFAYSEAGAAVASPLRVIFLGDRQAAIKEVPIAVIFKGTHHEARTFPFFLATQIPQGTQSIVLAYERERLFQAAVSAAQPSVRIASVERLDNDALRLHWETATQ